MNNAQSPSMNSHRGTFVVVKFTEKFWKFDLYQILWYNIIRKVIRGEIMNIRINNPIGSSNYLTIPSECWKNAIKEEHLTLSEFSLYLFLADHKDRETINMSRDVFEASTGYKKTSYNDAIRALTTKGFLVQKANHLYDFYTAPFRVDGKIPKYMFEEE